MKQVKLTLIICLATLIVGISGCDKSVDDGVTLWPVNNECNLHQHTCTNQYQGAEVSLKISPHPIPIARPLGIEVYTKNLEVSNIQIDISGKSMYMGYNRVPLTLARTQQNNEVQRYIGTSMLAFCTTQKMLWQITLIIDQPNGEQIQIPYNLETINRL